MDKRIYIDVDKLEDQLARLDRGIVVTRGHYETSSPIDVRDLDWNHMDPHHRPYIHRTYGNAVRLCTGSDFQLSLTKYGRLPFLLPVADIRIRPGLFYQCFSVFSVVSIIAVLRTTAHDGGADQRIDWFIVSKRIWKCLHPWLNAKMAKLNRVQNAEDAPVRQRRADLRKQGFRFKSDEPDYVISSMLTWHTLPPQLDRQYEIELKPSDGTETLQTFQAGPLSFLYTFDNAGVAQIWPEACPHEGGPLAQSLTSPAKGCLTCPWHGIEIRALRLSQQQPQGRCQGALLTLDGRTLQVAARAIDTTASTADSELAPSAFVPGNG
ncbi:MAG TPA: hypothetical protein VMI56_23605 [Reyranella sp.]|nr:hypothetical protein [Reyranella sp.]